MVVRMPAGIGGLSLIRSIPGVRFRPRRGAGRERWRREEVAVPCPLPTKSAAKLAVGDWIERVDNRRRRHSALGVISPVDFEDRLNQPAQAA